jgi:hypothetical protein
MRNEFRPYATWLGDWTGLGTTKKNVPVRIRLSIQPRMAGEVLELVLESLHDRTGKLVHGVVALLSVDPDGVMRMAIASTIHGTIIMPVTPEDPGALAFEGNSVTGNRVVVSFVEDNGALMLTAYWEPELPHDGEVVGFTNCRMQRVALADE